MSRSNPKCAYIVFNRMLGFVSGHKSVAAAKKAAKKQSRKDGESSVTKLCNEGKVKHPHFIHCSDGVCKKRKK